MDAMTLLLYKMTVLGSGERAMARGVHTFFRYFPVSERDRRWGLYLTTAGESRIPPAFDYPPRGHPGGYQFDWRKGRTLHEYQFVYISAGQGTLEMGRRRWRIEAGSAFVLHPGVWHRYRPDVETGWNEHWVGCDGPVIRGLVRHGFFSPRRPLQRVRDEDLLLAAFSSVIEAIHAGRPALQQVAAGGSLYIMSLLYSASQPGQSGPQPVARAVHEAMRRMADPAQDVGPLPLLARGLGVSYTWFRRAFAHHTGLSPHQYQLQLRIGRARTLLSETPLAVKEIAFRSGFESEQYFCRLFKRKTGVAPGEWRRRLRPSATRNPGSRRSSRA
jgi:AraC-like DNA-binding protein